MDTPDRTRVTYSKGVGREHLGGVLYKSIKYSVVYWFFTPPPCPVSVNTNQNFLRYRNFTSVLLWVFFSVVYQFFILTPPCPFHFGITVGIFLLYNLAGTPFEDFVGTLMLTIVMSTRGAIQGWVIDGEAQSNGGGAIINEMRESHWARQPLSARVVRTKQ